MRTSVLFFRPTLTDWSSRLTISELTLGISRLPNLMPGGIRVVIRPARRRQMLRTEVPLLALLALFFAVTLLVEPTMQVRGLGINLPNVNLCPFFSLTGIPDLFCGITRSLLAMGGLDVRSSFIFHPLGPAIYVFLLSLALLLAACIAAGRSPRLELERPMRRLMVWGGVILLIAAWALKLVLWHDNGLL